MLDVQVFNNPIFGDIRMVEFKGEPYVVGVDVARALDYAKPSQAVIDHCKGIRKLGIPSYNQHGAEVIQETNVIPEGDVYRLIIKAADQSKNVQIKERATKFESWVFQEVLPTIRKHGLYATEDLLDNPDLAIKAFTALKEEREKNKQLEHTIQEQQPLVEFAEAVHTSQDTIYIGDMVKLLNSNNFEIGQRRLFNLLREQKVLDNSNTPYQYFLNQKYFVVKERVYTANGEFHLGKTTLVTPKGQVWIAKKVKEWIAEEE